MLKSTLIMRFFISLLFVIPLSINLLYSQATLVLQPGPEDGKDTRINSLEEYTGGNQDEFMAAAWTYQSRPATDRSTIAFNMTTIPAGSTILNATLSLFGPPGLVSGGHSTLFGSNEAWIMRITSEWDEHAVIWETQPSTTLQNRVYVPESMKPYQDYELDVTNLVQDMIDDPENSFGFLFKLETEIYYRRLNFASSDHLDPTKRPKLEITFCESMLMADFTYIIEDLNVQFSNLSQNADSYLWDFGDGYFSILEHPDHVYDEEGDYEINLIATNVCSSDTAFKTIHICTLPVTGFDYSQNGFEVSFINSSTNFNECCWDFGDGYGASVLNPIYNYPEEGEYGVTLISLNECGADTLTQFITVSEDLPYEERSLLIYPNPTKGLLNIKLINVEPVDVNIELYSYGGKFIKSYKLFIDSESTIDLSEFSSGIYTLKLTSNLINNRFRKVVKLF